MSFKREGNDGSQLNLLKKRRVAELLAEDIPEDEAILMSSGRYACTVCHYRPVFDTVDMLTIHRAGKKHQHANDRHFAKKRELALLVQKRYHESQLKRESLQGSSENPGPAPLLQKVEEAKRHVLLKEAPYNPCHSHRNEGPSTKPKGKLFFQGIRQMQLKNIHKKSTNQGVQNSNLTSQRLQAPSSSNQLQTDLTSQGLNSSSQLQTDSTNQGLQNSNSANQKPENFNVTNQVGANLNYAQKQQQHEADIHERIKSFSKQTSAPGVPTIAIKPYVPKSRRGKAITLTNSSKESKQSSSLSSNKSNLERFSNQSSDACLPTSSSGETTQHNMRDDESVPGKFPGQEVANLGLQYISEYESEGQVGPANSTVPWSNVDLTDTSEDDIRAGNVEQRGNLKAGCIKALGSFRDRQHIDGPHAVGKRQAEQVTFASRVQNEQLPFVSMKQRELQMFGGSAGHMQLKCENKRQDTQMEDQRNEMFSKTLHFNGRKTPENEQGTSYEGRVRDTTQERSNLNLADRQKVEQVEETGKEAIAPPSCRNVNTGGLIIKWRSGQEKIWSKNVSDSAASSQPSTDHERQADEKGKESRQDGRYHPALQLFNNRQKSGLSSRDESTDSQSGVNSEQTAKEECHVQQKEEERRGGRRGEKLKKERQKSGQQMSEERRKELQRYLELTSAGWIQDPGGQWVKGQDVEFDSDEEPPS